MQIGDFQALIWDFWGSNKRSLPWRETRDPYKILVSEIMLQQTQVDRVIPKYSSWIGRFPGFESLADAPLKEVLGEWQGLGYNRRGLHLKQASQIIVSEFEAKLPQNTKDLLSLPGIGPYTARAVQAFAWNKPSIFIETNIRTVYLHHFFPKEEKVHDRELLPYIEKSLPQERAREWYWALMDYGAYLKKELPNPSRNSRHHTKQSPFKGSNREVRSKILKFVLQHEPVRKDEVLKHIRSEKWNVENNITSLTNEGFLTDNKGIYSIGEK